MAPPTAPAKTVDGGADDANLPVADVVVADETGGGAHRRKASKPSSRSRPQQARSRATRSWRSASSARRSRARCSCDPGPPAGRVAVVESQYYGPVSFLASCLLFTVFPPCALIPASRRATGPRSSPCSPRRRSRNRRVFVVVPPGAAATTRREHRPSCACRRARSPARGFAPPSNPRRHKSCIRHVSASKSRKPES